MNIGFIPIRKGSKGIPGKNTKKLLGRPLFTWVLGEAILSNLDEIYIYTDDEKLIQFINNEYKYTGKVFAIRRDDKNATDISSTEDAIEDFINSYSRDFSTFTLLQATSPLISANDINNSLNLVLSGQYDSSVSVVRKKRFYWNENGESINYDYLKRPRRQDFKGNLVENGAVYTISYNEYIKSKNRLGGKIGINEMQENSYYEIDEEADFLIIETLLSEKLKQKKQIAVKLKAIVLDVDGVFTDGKIFYSIEGEFGKTFNMRDGMGLENLSKDIIVYVLTSEDSPIVKERMKKLNISNGYYGIKDKFLKLEYLLKDANLGRNEILYMGDDVNDLSNILSCGWGVCPQDATDEIKKYADLTLNNNGGEMAIRNAITFLNKYNQRFK